MLFFYSPNMCPLRVTTTIKPFPTKWGRLMCPSRVRRGIFYVEVYIIWNFIMPCAWSSIMICDMWGPLLVLRWGLKGCYFCGWLYTYDLVSELESRIILPCDGLPWPCVMMLGPLARLLGEYLVVVDMWISHVWLTSWVPSGGSGWISHIRQR